ncbi:unnamed protein product [Effrenium voratum]|nr:unnamed protein product [Effrenium voratum]
MKANIKRVVLTSSIAAVGPPMKWFQDGGDDKVWTEDDWNDEEPDNPVKGYRASKALAEKKAWELSKELNVDLAVICPGFVLGPMLSSRADGESVLFMKGMLVTDVRDLALAHVRAMEKEEAVGKRIIVSSETGYSVVKMAELLGDRYKAYPLPTTSQEMSASATFKSKYFKEVLGVSMRPVEVTLRDMAAASLRLGITERKFVKKAAKPFGNVADIQPDSRGVYLLTSVVEIGAKEEGKGDTFTEVVVGDSSGIVTLRLNSEEMKAISVGDVVEIRNAAVKMMTVRSMGRDGSMMSVIEVKAAQVTHPTGDPKFSVMQPFPAAISEKDADPFLMCDEFGPAVSSGKETDPDRFPVAWHPHMGMDIMTYMREGRGRHADSLGNREEFDSPGFQWISVGSGIEHAEGGGTAKGETQHGFQIWLNVPKAHKADDPAYGTVSSELLTDFDSEHGRARLLAGPYGGKEGAFKTKQSVQMIDFEVIPRAAFCHQIPEHMETVLVYCYRGSLRVGAEGKSLPAQHVARLDGNSRAHRELLLEAGEEGAGCLLFAGKRINESIAWHGPFVASDKKELVMAFRAYQDGSFPPKRVPWDYRKAAAMPK